MTTSPITIKPVERFTLISPRGHVTFRISHSDYDRNIVQVTTAWRGFGQSKVEVMTRAEARLLWRKLEKSGYERF